LNQNDIKFLEDSFKKYYFDHFDLIHVPPRASEREFGYQKFDSGMTRHIIVKDDKELHLLLMNSIPSDVYCSNAYYSFPNLPMTEKDWKEADLIFDIDAKDLNLDCRKNHLYQKCKVCNRIFQNLSYCPYCKSTKFDSSSLPCKNCILVAKNEVKKLQTILTNDLGIAKENIDVYFSGNEGFHVYAYNTSFEKLGSKERSDIVDYLMFRGAIPETFGFNRFKPDRSLFSEFDESGWSGRVSKKIFDSNSKRSKIISQILANGYSSFQKQLDDIRDEIGVKIDPMVTVDVHRIFRLPGSLNSKSGLTKQKCEDLDSFNPYSEACFIDDTPIEAVADCTTRFSLKNKQFGPYNHEKITVPRYAAVYMICKGLATTKNTE